MHRLVRAIAGSRAGHTFMELGPVELKGLPDPVEVCEVEWAPADAGPLELPSLLAGGQDPAADVYARLAPQLGLLGVRWDAATLLGP